MARGLWKKSLPWPRRDKALLLLVCLFDHVLFVLVQLTEPKINEIHDTIFCYTTLGEDVLPVKKPQQGLHFVGSQIAGPLIVFFVRGIGLARKPSDMQERNSRFLDVTGTPL